MEARVQMLVIMEADATEDQIHFVVARMIDTGLNAYRDHSGSGVLIYGIGHSQDCDEAKFASMPGVRDSIRISSKTPLSDRAACPAGTRVVAGDVTLGGRSVEVIWTMKPDQFCKLSDAELGILINTGFHLVHVGTSGRGCALGSEPSIDHLSMACPRAAAMGLSLICDSVDFRGLHAALPPTAMMRLDWCALQDPDNANAARRVPILLSRGIAERVFDVLKAADTVLSWGNDRVVLCTGAIRTFDPTERLTFDLSAVSALKRLTHLPVTADATCVHASRGAAISMALAAIAAGADGVLLRWHDFAAVPTTDVFRFCEQVSVIAEAIGRTVPSRDGLIERQPR